VLERSANAHGMPWGADSRELLIRYGWSEWFTRQVDDIGGVYATPRVTGHDREPSYHFYPQLESLGRFPRLTAESWKLREPMARGRYAPRFLTRLTDLPHQLARFPRGDSMLLAVSYRVADSVLARDTQTARMLTGSGRREATSAPLEMGRGLVLAPNDTTVVSVEVRGDSTKRAARARFTVDPLTCSSSLCLSDLLLFDASGSPVSAVLDSVLPRAAADLRFSNQKPLGLYWETQRAELAPMAVRVSLTVSAIRPSLARRVATRLRVLSQREPVRLRWQATLRADSDAQVLSVQLPRNARGRYRVLLVVEPPGGPAVSAVREIELLP
jgi:hypothetical protein